LPIVPSGNEIENNGIKLVEMAKIQDEKKWGTDFVYNRFK
jgi:hypothetical protein